MSCLWQRHYKQMQQNPTIAQSIDAPGCYFSLLSKVLFTIVSLIAVIPSQLIK
jgi:hypothetical protein